MGLFDGSDGKTECGSTDEIAKWLQAPVLLVVDAWCLSRSAADIAHGYSSFDHDLTFADVIFNKIGGDCHVQWLEEAIQSSPLTQLLFVLGCISKDAQVVVPERHLGNWQRLSSSCCHLRPGRANTTCLQYVLVQAESLVVV
jgi:cobyrinic acid a,c-diamide synthase